MTGHQRDHDVEDDVKKDEYGLEYVNEEDTPCKPGLDECGINALCDSLLEICICQEGSFGIYPGCCKENCERKRNGICDENTRTCTCRNMEASWKDGCVTK